MHSNRPFLIVLAVVSATLMLVEDFLLNLVSTYFEDTLKPYAPWVFGVLFITFVASVGLLIWQLRAEPQASTAATRYAGPSIEQHADGGEIIRSPNRIAGQTAASIRQSATDGGRIEESGNTIE